MLSGGSGVRKRCDRSLSEEGDVSRQEVLRKKDEVASRIERKVERHPHGPDLIKVPQKIEAAEGDSVNAQSNSSHADACQEFPEIRHLRQEIKK